MNAHRTNFKPEPTPLRWATTMSIVFVLLFIALLGPHPERRQAESGLLCRGAFDGAGGLGGTLQ